MLATFHECYSSLCSFKSFAEFTHHIHCLARNDIFLEVMDSVLLRDLNYVQLFSRTNKKKSIRLRMQLLSRYYPPCYTVPIV